MLWIDYLYHYVSDKIHKIENQITHLVTVVFQSFSSQWAEVTLKGQSHPFVRYEKKKYESQTAIQLKYHTYRFTWKNLYICTSLGKRNNGRNLPIIFCVPSFFLLCPYAFKYMYIQYNGYNSLRTMFLILERIHCIVRNGKPRNKSCQH